MIRKHYYQPTVDTEPQNGTTAYTVREGERMEEQPPPLNPVLYEKMIEAIRTCKELAADIGGNITAANEQLWEQFALYAANLTQANRDSYESFVRFIAPLRGASPEDVRTGMTFFWTHASHLLPSGTSLHLESGIPLLANAIERYLQDHLTQERLGDKRSRLYGFLRWCDSQPEPIVNVLVNGAQLNEYFHWLRYSKPVESGPNRGQRGLKPQGLQNHRNVLNHFFNWCIKKGWCVANPVSSSVKRFVNSKKKKIKVSPIDRSKLRDFLATFDENDFLQLRNKLLVSYWYDFGRISEVERLEIKDLDLDLRAHTGEVRVDTKHNQTRLMEFSELTTRLLQKYLVKRDKLIRNKQKRLRNQGRRADARQLDHGYLFVSSKTGMPLTESGAYRAVAKAGKRAGMPEFTPARLRKGAAADHILSGGTHDGLQHRMFHSSVKTTERYTLGARAEKLAPLPGDRLLNEQEAS